ncbi:B3 domain-containing protein Os01g0234100-like isoform X2 [Cornus florida]|uniref:B3 domain-containing protein Os01g0234100-like isoform X2 n=1 Tax=Cornus florida TaxID=4283 RepID=UPI0028A0A229|nr:B3 domain-containing protein Os01g0234100-like isoform X2 [Cornus florida]
MEKIEVVKLNEGLNHGDNCDQNVFEKEVLEEEEQGHVCECPISSEQSVKSTKDNLNLIQLSNTPPALSPSTPSMGKQKKPHEIKDKMSPMKKKKRPGSISEHTITDDARKFYKPKRAASNALNSPGEVKSSAMIRAEEVQSSLGTEFPSFVKVMVRSHVSSCFWMRLPVPFCKSHLPKNDAIISLENESGEQFDLKFIADKQGLSAGWRKFAILHELLERDVLIFQLTKATKFKVYIIRANDFNEVDGARGLLNLDAYTKQNAADGSTIALRNTKRKRLKSGPVWPVEQSENVSDVIASEVLVGSKVSGSSVAFGDIKSFDDFKITLNRLYIDSELPERVWTKYYELCCSKNSFLHANLLQGLNCTLVTGIIFETVNIADAIRGCKLTTSKDEFVNWGKTLKSFEVMGMNVGFLLARLRRLQTLAFESEDALKAKRYIEGKAKRVQAEKWIRSLEEKLAQLKEASEKIDADTETLESKAESYKVKFQKEVDTPW